MECKWKQHNAEKDRLLHILHTLSTDDPEWMRVAEKRRILLIENMCTQCQDLFIAQCPTGGNLGG